MIIQPVRLIPGGLHRDQRGVVRHVNGFSFVGVERFYTVHPAVVNEVRGWVGHKRESRWFFVVRGCIELGVVRVEDWDNPSAHLPVQHFSLNAEAPEMIEVPPGHFTASVACEPDSILVIFSSGQFADSKTDNYRLPPEHWPMSPSCDH